MGHILHVVFHANRCLSLEVLSSGPNFVVQSWPLDLQGACYVAWRQESGCCWQFGCLMEMVIWKHEYLYGKLMCWVTHGRTYTFCFQAFKTEGKLRQTFTLKCISSKLLPALWKRLDRSCTPVASVVLWYSLDVGTSDGCRWGHMRETNVAVEHDKHLVHGRSLWRARTRARQPHTQHLRHFIRITHACKIGICNGQDLWVSPYLPHMVYYRHNIGRIFEIDGFLSTATSIRKAPNLYTSVCSVCLPAIHNEV